MEEQADSSTVASSRPVRAAVVNAAAISEAQADILSRFDRYCIKLINVTFVNDDDFQPREC